MTRAGAAAGGRSSGRVTELVASSEPPLDAADALTRLAEAKETLRAIRNGEVDALVVQDASPAAQVFTFASADRPYRMFVENMRDGAATVSESGIILYANRRLAHLLTNRLPNVRGAPIRSFVASEHHVALDAISGRAHVGGTIEAELVATTGPGSPFASTARRSTSTATSCCV
jgi:PAS domain-containing protein